RLHQHVGEDRYGVAALDHAMDMAERLQQRCAFDGDFHVWIRPLAWNLSRGGTKVARSWLLRKGDRAPGGHFQRLWFQRLSASSREVDTVFRKRSCATKKLERDDDSKKSHPALDGDDGTATGRGVRPAPRPARLQVCPPSAPIGAEPACLTPAAVASRARSPPRARCRY